MPNLQQPATLTKEEWDTILSRISMQKCTPFLGAEASGGLMSPRSEIAKRWADECNFPLEGPRDLAQVAQFLATTAPDPTFAREKILDEFRRGSAANFTAFDEPHRILAELPLPVYVTTDYHDFMTQALRNQHRAPQQELCRWRDDLRGERSMFDGNFEPNVPNPVVFHLYGHTGVPESLVLTEDDYLDFLVEISKTPTAIAAAASKHSHDAPVEAIPIPLPIQRAFSRTSLLFLGYRLTDLEFRVLLRALATVKLQKQYLHLAVQLVQLGDRPESEEQLGRLARVKQYLDKYCKRAAEITTYWGTTHDFLVELKQRWDQLPDDKKRPKI